MIAHSLISNAFQNVNTRTKRAQQYYFEHSLIVRTFSKQCNRQAIYIHYERSERQMPAISNGYLDSPIDLIGHSKTAIRNLSFCV